MRHLAGVIQDGLHWSQPRILDRRWELRRGGDDEVVATLVFTSAFGRFATAATAAIVP